MNKSLSAAHLTAVTAVLWTLLLAASLSWTLSHEREAIMDLAYAEARANLNKDLSLRRWVTSHGGVYVPVTETQQPVPWLKHVPGQTVTTDGGQTLTLLNPASVLRQMMDRYAAEYGIRGRITGLRYLNPGNAPDAWERAQLEAFERREREEVWDVSELDGQPHLRYLRAMFMDRGCEKCHAILNYRLGEVRGGVGLNLPLASYYRKIDAVTFNMGASYGLIWLLGLAGIAWGGRQVRLREVASRQNQEILEASVAARTVELAATEEKVRLVLESTADGLIGVECDGRVTFINSAACVLLGYKAEQLMGRNVHASIHHRRGDGRPYPAAECLVLRAVESGQVLRNDNDTLWRFDGSPLPVSLTVQPMRRGDETIGAVIGFADSRERLAAAAAREAALAEATRLAQVKSEFLANMSHEIRTPLNGVLGMARMGLRKSQGRGEARDAFARIIESGSLLVGIIDDILDFSKIEAGKMRIELRATRLADCVVHSLDLVRDRAQAKGIALDIDLAAELPPACLIDPLRLGQILLNLLSNAIKFTERGGVRLSVLPEGGERLLLRVADTGIGMTPEQIQRIFDPFEQGDGTTTRRFGGTGLGLAIVARLTALLDGAIEVRSEPGVGTTVEVRLPLVAVAADELPPPTEDAATPSAAGRYSGLHVLVAEDNPINQLVIVDMLEVEGAAVEVVGDGSEAVERVRERGAAGFDLVLMDIQMPRMNGYEATQRIHELAPALPVVALTAHALAEERERCLAAGMADLAVKPIDQYRLREILAAHGGPHAAAAAAAAPEAAPMPETIPTDATAIVDWTALEAAYAERPALLVRLCEVFLSTKAELPTQLREAAAAKDLPRLAALAHREKSPLASLKAGQAAALAVQTEQAALAGQPAAPEMARQLADAVEAVTDALRQRG